MLTDKQIQDAVFAVLRRWEDDRAWDRYTRESGPYDVTSLRAEVLEIIRAVLAVAGSEASGETMAQREDVCAAWADLPPALTAHPGLKRLYRALGGIPERNAGVRACDGAQPSEGSDA